MGFAENDDILSEILDGLIEFQEKSPVARTADPVGGNQFHSENQISSIEKYLASTERTVLTPPGKDQRDCLRPDTWLYFLRVLIFLLLVF